MMKYSKFRTSPPKIPPLSPTPNIPPPSLSPPPPFHSSSISFRLLPGLNPDLFGHRQGLSLCTNSANLWSKWFFRNINNHSIVLIQLPTLGPSFILVFISFYSNNGNFPFFYLKLLICKQFCKWYLKSYSTSENFLSFIKILTWY